MALDINVESFQSPEVEQAASKMGFVKSEFPKLARAAHFYAQTAGVSELDALPGAGRGPGRSHPAAGKRRCDG